MNAQKPNKPGAALNSVCKKSISRGIGVVVHDLTIGNCFHMRASNEKTLRQSLHLFLSDCHIPIRLNGLILFVLCLPILTLSAQRAINDTLTLPINLPTGAYEL